MTDPADKKQDIKVFETRIAPDMETLLNPGQVLIDGKRLFAATSDGIVEILEVQPSGKKRMPASAFLLGYHPLYFV